MGDYKINNFFSVGMDWGSQYPQNLLAYAHADVDFSVDFSRDRLHAAQLCSFCAYQRLHKATEWGLGRSPSQIEFVAF
jgi:hypothetical protein